MEAGEVEARDWGVVNGGFGLDLAFDGERGDGLEDGEGRASLPRGRQMTNAQHRLTVIMIVVIPIVCVWEQEMERMKVLLVFNRKDLNLPKTSFSMINHRHAFIIIIVIISPWPCWRWQWRWRWRWRWAIHHPTTLNPIQANLLKWNLKKLENTQRTQNNQTYKQKYNQQQKDGW